MDPASATEEASSRLAALLQELFLQGGVVITTPPLTDDASVRPAFSTLIQPDGDIIVSVARGHENDRELWARHMAEVRQRLEPMEELRRALRSAGTYLSVGTALGALWGAGSLLLQPEALVEWAQGLLPFAAMLLLRLGLHFFTPRLLPWLLRTHLEGLPDETALQGPPRAAG